MVAAERDEPQAVGEHFILNDGGILVDENVLDGESGDFS